MLLAFQMPFNVVYQLAFSVFAAAVPTSILSDDVYSSVDRYGIGILFLFAAWFFHRKLEKLEKERKKDHDSHIKALNDEIEHLRKHDKD